MNDIHPTFKGQLDSQHVLLERVVRGSPQRNAAEIALGHNLSLIGPALKDEILIFAVDSGESANEIEGVLCDSGLNVIAQASINADTHGTILSFVAEKIDAGPRDIAELSAVAPSLGREQANKGECPKQL